MKIVFVSVGNFQEYVISNIRNCQDFGNHDIAVITNAEFMTQLDKLSVEYVNADELQDEFDFCKSSRLDKESRGGFWHYCSLRFFYIYAYMKKWNVKDVIHLENDTMSYLHFDTEFLPHVAENKKDKVYATFDGPARIVPGIMYIPSAQCLRPILERFDAGRNDMENFAKDGETFVHPLPIWPVDVYCPALRYNRLYPEFGMIFDAAMLGQYAGGIDPRNQHNLIDDSRGFINPDCFYAMTHAHGLKWMKVENQGQSQDQCAKITNELYAPYFFLTSSSAPIKIANLHIHCKRVENFMGNLPMEEKFIPYT